MIIIYRGKETTIGELQNTEFALKCLQESPESFSLFLNPEEPAEMQTLEFGQTPESWAADEQEYIRGLIFEELGL
jgi:hypothetical protein